MKYNSLTVMYKGKEREVLQRVRNPKGYIYLIKLPRGNVIDLVKVSEHELDKREVLS
jgi:hypothetical protein